MVGARLFLLAPVTVEETRACLHDGERDRALFLLQDRDCVNDIARAKSLYRRR